MKILLPIDGSEAANEAVDFVRVLAEDNPVSVIVLMVTHVPVNFTMQPDVTDWTAQENLHAQKVLAKAKRSLKTNCQSVTVIRDAGPIIPSILNHAKKSKVDLIALGAKGHWAVRRVLLGSVSDSIATRANCSVVVVRGKPNKECRLDRVLLAFDKSVASREAVTEWMQLKLNRETNVRVLSVAQKPMVYIGDGYEPSAIDFTQQQLAPIREACDRMASQIAEHFPHTEASTIVADHVGDAIVNAAESEKADVIVVGDTGHNWLGDFFLGSTSKYVLRHADCSVWISRHHWKNDASQQPVTDTAATVPTTLHSTPK